MWRGARGMVLASSLVRGFLAPRVQGVVSFVCRAAPESLTVYSTLGCPHCVRCKRALEEADLSFDVVDVSDGEARAALETLAGASSVPQVFLGDELIGGADDTLARLEDGTLFGRNIARRKRERSAPVRRGAGGETSGVDVGSLVAAGGSLNALASEAADTLEAFRSETVQGDEDAASRLQRCALQLVDAHVSESGVDYESLRTSAAFLGFVAASADVAALDPSQSGVFPLRFLRTWSGVSVRSHVSDAFWINLYNAMVLHATAVLGGPEDSPDARAAFFSGATGATYDVCGQRAARVV